MFATKRNKKAFEKIDTKLAQGLFSKFRIHFLQQGR